MNLEGNDDTAVRAIFYGPYSMEVLSTDTCEQIRLSMVSLKTAETTFGYYQVITTGRMVVAVQEHWDLTAPKSTLKGGVPIIKYSLSLHRLIISILQILFHSVH